MTEQDFIRESKRSSQRLSNGWVSYIDKSVRFNSLNNKLFGIRDSVDILPLISVNVGVKQYKLYFNTVTLCNTQYTRIWDTLGNFADIRNLRNYSDGFEQIFGEKPDFLLKGTNSIIEYTVDPTVRKPGLNTRAIAYKIPLTDARYIKSLLSNKNLREIIAHNLGVCRVVACYAPDIEALYDSTGRIEDRNQRMGIEDLYDDLIRPSNGSFQASNTRQLGGETCHHPFGSFVLSFAFDSETPIEETRPDEEEGSLGMFTRKTYTSTTLMPFLEVPTWVFLTGVKMKPFQKFAEFSGELKSMTEVYSELPLNYKKRKRYNSLNPDEELMSLRLGVKPNNRDRYEMHEYLCIRNVLASELRGETSRFTGVQKLGVKYKGSLIQFDRKLIKADNEAYALFVYHANEESEVVLRVRLEEPINKLSQNYSMHVDLPVKIMQFEERKKLSNENGVQLVNSYKISTKDLALAQRDFIDVIRRRIEFEKRHQADKKIRGN